MVHFYEGLLDVRTRFWVQARQGGGRFKCGGKHYAGWACLEAP